MFCIFVFKSNDFSNFLIFSAEALEEEEEQALDAEVQNAEQEEKSTKKRYVTFLWKI